MVNKKNITFMSLLALCVAAVGGCSEKSNVSNVVLEIGKDKYTAQELYSQLLSNGAGANEAFNMILRLVVESSMETTKNIQASADLAAKKFYQEVETNAQQNGISKKEAEKKLLEEKGFSSVDELKSDMIYQQKLTRLSEQFWTLNKKSFYNEFVETRLPYLVSHVLVKLDDNTNANKIANNVNVSQKEAEKIYKVIDRFRKGDKFAYVASQESEDPGSTASGGAYYMDTTTSFVDEFLYGTYLFDSYTTLVKNADKPEESYVQWGRVDKKYNMLKDVGFINEEAYKDNKDSFGTDEDSIAKYYDNGVNFVDMSIVDKLGEVANKTSTGDFHYIGYVNDDTYVSDSNSSEFDSSLNNINTNYTAYARSIIFNRAFNRPGISVIGYDKKPEDVKNCIKFKWTETIKKSGQADKKVEHEKWILTDENKNPIFFVAAKGSSNDIWLHFLTINISSLNDLDKAKAYFTIETPNKDDKNAPLTYVKQFGDGTLKKERELINKLESYVKSFATSGSGEELGDESLLTFAMVDKYMADNKIKITDPTLKAAMEAYMASKRELFGIKQEENMLNTFNGHEEKLSTSEEALIKMGIKPYECGVVLDSDAYAPINNSTSNGNLCRYVYGKGYQVKVSFFYHSNLSTSDNSYTRITDKSNIAKFNPTDDQGNKFTTWQWLYVEQEGKRTKMDLPVPIMDEGYEFHGWYASKDLANEHMENGTAISNPKIESVDYSTSSINNHTIFYADITKKTGKYNIVYNYKFAGTKDSIAVDSQYVNQITDPTKGEGKYAPIYFDYDVSTGKIQTLKIDGASAFLGKPTSSGNKYVEFVGFDPEGKETERVLTFDGTGMDQKIVIDVYFKPVQTKLEYEFVDSDGKSLQINPGIIDTALTTIYKPEDINGNMFNVLPDEFFTLGENYKFEGTIKYKKAGATNDWINLPVGPGVPITQSDMGNTITIYIVLTGGNN